MQRNKRLLYLIPLIIILTGLLIYQYGYTRMRTELSSMKEEESIKLEKLKRYVQIISERPLLEKRLAELKKQRLDDNAKLIDAPTAAMAGASLQNMINEIFTKNGGIMGSQRIENVEERGKFRIVSVTINGSVNDTNALRDIIYSIETNIPYMFVKNLDTRVKNFKKPTGELTVNLTVSALTTAK